MLKIIVLGGLVAVSLLISAGEARGQAGQLTPQSATQAAPPASISPLELRQFAQVLKQLEAIELEMQRKMALVIQKEGLSPQRFIEIDQQLQNPFSPSAAEVTEGEREQYKAARVKIEEIIQETKPRQERAVIAQGLELQRFAQIGQRVNQDRALQQRVQQMLGK